MGGGEGNVSRGKVGGLEGGLEGGLWGKGGDFCKYEEKGGWADLFLFVAFLTQVLAASGHFCSAHGVFFGCEMLLRLGFWWDAVSMSRLHCGLCQGRTHR